MPPTRPNSVHLLFLRNAANEVNIGIVVDILARRNLNEGIGKANELCVCVQVILGCHRNKCNELL